MCSGCKLPFVNKNVPCSQTLVELSCSQYFSSLPPAAIYTSSPPSAGTTQLKNVRHPQATCHWSGFKNDVSQFLRPEQHSQAGNCLLSPVFVDFGIIRSEVPDLQACVSLNLFKIVAKAFDCDNSTYGRDVKGKPDGYVIENGSEKVRLVYEVKGNWTLDPSLFEDDRIDQYASRNRLLEDKRKHIRHAIYQVYTYMVLNYMKYAVLTSYDVSFFLKRVKVEDADDGAETLFISEAIYLRDSACPILACIAYILSQADGSPFANPPDSPPAVSASTTPDLESPSHEAVTTPRSSPRPLRRINEIPFSPCSRHSRHGSVETMDDETVVDCIDSFPQLTMNDLNLSIPLGLSRSKVFFEPQRKIAVKTIDLFKEYDYLQELVNEIGMYESLSDLQGNGIPRLELCGLLEGALFCVGLSLCGQVPDALTLDQKAKLLETLDAIHSHGILHNDIKKENILVDEDGFPYLIDFGFAQMTVEQAKFDMERDQLVECMSKL